MKNMALMRRFFEFRHFFFDERIDCRSYDSKDNKQTDHDPDCIRSIWPINASCRFSQQVYRMRKWQERIDHFEEFP